MPPRSFPAIVPDSCILELFTTPSKQLKAHRVLLLLGLARSKARNIQSALRRLAKQGALVELPSPSSAQRHPLYALPLLSISHTHATSSADVLDDIRTASNDVICTPAPTEPPLPSVDSTFSSGAITDIVQPSSTVLLAEKSAAAEAEEATSQHPVCAVCRESWPTEVLLPCRHQACCKACWLVCTLRERKIHNKRERLKRELGARGVVRCAFRPRCPICMSAVEEVISPYTNL